MRRKCWKAAASSRRRYLQGVSVAGNVCTWGRTDQSTAHLIYVKIPKSEEKGNIHQKLQMPFPYGQDSQQYECDLVARSQRDSFVASSSLPDIFKYTPLVTLHIISM